MPGHLHTLAVARPGPRSTHYLDMPAPLLFDIIFAFYIFKCAVTKCRVLQIGFWVIPKLQESSISALSTIKTFLSLARQVF